MADASFFVRKKPYATEQLTVSTGVSVPTAATVRNTTGTAGVNTNYWAVSFPASAAFVNVATNDVIYTLDGSTPTSTNGIRVTAGGSITLAGRGQVAGLKMIRSGASDAVVNIAYYKE